MLVARVEDDSPADLAGLEPDDLIIKVGGKTVKDVSGLRLDIGGRRPGTEVEFTVLRDGEEKDITATLGSMEKGQAVSFNERTKRRAPAAAVPSRDELADGVVIENLTPRIRAAYRLGSDVEGVIVAGVERSAPGSNRRLATGDIILEVERETVSSVEDAMRIAENGSRRGLLVRVRGKDASTRLLVLKS